MKVKITYFGHAFLHVLHMGAHCVDGCKLLPVSKPFLNFQCLWCDHFYIHWQMTEVTNQCASRSFDGNIAGTNLYCHCARNIDSMITFITLRAKLKPHMIYSTYANKMHKKEKEIEQLNN